MQNKEILCILTIVLLSKKGDELKMNYSHEAFQRPLESRTNTQWEGMVTPMVFTNGERTKVYQWSLRSKGKIGLIGGAITVIPDRGVIAFSDRMMDQPKYHEDPENILRILDKYGWGEPSHFDEIVESLNDFKRFTKLGMSQDFALTTIVEKWQNIDKPSTEVEKDAKRLLDF